MSKLVIQEHQSFITLSHSGVELIFYKGFLKLAAMLVSPKDAKFVEVDEAIVVAALGGNTKFKPSSTVKLRSLNCAQLCQLFEHCFLYNLGDFIHHNKLTGMHLDEGIECIQDLIDLGLDKLTSKVLWKRILVWKEERLPQDFQPTFTTASAATRANDFSCMHISEKQLNDDFLAARWCRSREATDRIIAAANVDNHLAQAFLSVLSNRDETLVERDDVKAVQYATSALAWLRVNASGHNMYALYNLALCYEDGRGVQQNTHEAVRCARLAADQGHECALHYLSVCYDEGAGVAKDKSSAAHYLKLAAEKGHMCAQFDLGVNYTNGTGVVKDEKEAFRYYKLAADQGYGEAQYWLGRCYENGTGVAENFREMLKYYKLAADQGVKGAEFCLARCYETGTGVCKDITEAVRRYKLAADDGDMEAMFNLGVIYELKENTEEAFRYYKMASDQGDAEAQLIVGGFYQEGTSVKKDKKEAFRYYKMAADQGYADAQYWLGRRYADGKGVKVNKIEAVKCYLQAAEQGHAEAIKILVNCNV